MKETVGKTRRIFPGWLVVAAGFACMMVGAGVGWGVLPVFMTTIQEDMGWSRGEISGAVSLSAIVWAVCGPLVGVFIDRYGPRRLMIAGVLMGFVVTILMSRMSALWHLYALFFLGAIGGAANGYIPITATVSHWFDKKRGLAMGTALLGMGVGGFVMPNLANYWLTVHGWRTSYFLFSFFFLALVVPIYLWVHHKPSDLGMYPDGEEPEEILAEADPEVMSSVNVGLSLTAREAARTRSFWGLGLGDLLIAIALTSIGLHMVAFATDSGISQTSATTAFSVMQGLSTLGMLAFGLAADRLSVRGLLTLSYAVPIVAIPFLLNSHSLWALYVYVFLVGISGGGRAAVWPLALSHCFGLRHVGALMGWLAILFTLGNAFGPPMAGHIYDTTHSYQSWFIVCLILTVFSPVLVYLMRDERGTIRPDR